MGERDKRFYIETLGCPRNDSDSEAIITILEGSNYKNSDSPEEASTLIINGCAFIEEAVSQSIERILTLSQRNPKATILVVGCLAQRYKERLKDALPEIDLLVGTGSITYIVESIEERRSILASNEGFIGRNAYKRHHTTPAHYRYIKITEGCDYECSFCVIPGIKGTLRSKPLEVIKEEISSLSKEVREIILVGQDTSAWGQDIYGKPALDYLLKELSPLFPHWIRILYLHPLTIDESLLQTISSLPNVFNYLDIPFQHISTPVLMDMKRGYDRSFIENLLKMIQGVDDFTIRTTLIVGFPMETEENFEELISFIENAHLDRIGIFKFSREEETNAYSMKQLDSKIIDRRFVTLFNTATKKMAVSNKEMIGKRISVLIDAKQSGEYYGRTEMDAPEIDQILWIKGNLKIGKFYSVIVTDALESELIGELL
ncbi:30S ribosomal protein S12 methylthiotransferase RimO [candidate division WOR-3 bacterium]|nr:30S ribosomal protein S12 methylthiotransferase RimO [candidate division WOR-3 bacterium]